METPSTWDPTKGMLNFLKKHFNRCLTDDKRTSILADYPKPNTPVLQAPRLDDDVKEQFKKKGKDPHFGQEQVLFKLQDSLLEVSGPVSLVKSD